MRVEKLVQLAAPIEHPIPEADVWRPLSAMTPLTERAACGDQAEFGVVRFVISVGIKSAHLALASFAICKKVFL